MNEASTKVKIEKFEDIIAWQKSRDLSALIYSIFRESRDFGFKDQILRASVSAMNNIAEGYERGGNKEFKRFLYIAKGSAAEVRSMLDLALRLESISDEDFKLAYDVSLETSRLLSGLIKTL